MQQSFPAFRGIENPGRHGQLSFEVGEPDAAREVSHSTAEALSNRVAPQKPTSHTRYPKARSAKLEDSRLPSKRALS